MFSKIPLIFWRLADNNEGQASARAPADRNTVKPELIYMYSGSSTYYPRQRKVFYFGMSMLSLTKFLEVCSWRVKSFSFAFPRFFAFSLFHLLIADQR